MKITLITACYNSATVIRTAMDSVLAQSWPMIEYLVVDGGSSDGTLESIREYEPKFAGRMRWISEPDCGMYDAINKGIRLATGDLVGDVLRLTLNSERLKKLTESYVVSNAKIKRALGWERMPVEARDGIRTTLMGLSKDR